MECFLLLFRGVNISFKAGDIHDVRFPGAPPKRTPGNEQYFALQIVLKGLETIYSPPRP